MKVGKLASPCGPAGWRSPRGGRLSPILNKNDDQRIPSHESDRGVDQKSLAEKFQPTEGRDAHQTIRDLPSQYLEKGT
jgi:hypothetical protein